MDNKKRPLISIITVTYNSVSLLEKTILSVLNQTYGNSEYIVIDGGSTDGTLDIIKAYQDNISFWLSEPDKGIYDAMNKGIDRASGEWIININCGDELLTIPIEELEIASYRNMDALCGAVVSENNIIQYPSFNKTILLHNTLPHQGLFYRKKSLYSKYDLSYSVFADYAYNIGMYKRKQKVFLSHKIISFHSTDGVSNTPKSSRELLTVIYQKCGILWFILSFFQFKIKGIRKKAKDLFS